MYVGMYKMLLRRVNLKETRITFVFVYISRWDRYLSNTQVPVTNWKMVIEKAN